MLAYMFLGYVLNNVDGSSVPFDLMHGSGHAVVCVACLADLPLIQTLVWVYQVV